MRRVFIAAALLIGARATVVEAPAKAAEPTPTFAFGSGAASASVARARLFYGGLSLPLGVGTTSASYTNQQSRALGIALDLGAYLGLAGDVPPQFAPSAIDSNSGDKEAHGNLDAGEAVARVNLRATRVPASSSEVHMTDLDLPALVRVEGAHAVSTTEVRQSRQRRASAAVDVARVSIADGLVVLNDLHWDAVQTTGFEPVATAAFTIGSASIAGLPIPLNAADANTGLDPINAALLPVGLRIEAPKINHSSAGGISMAPLRVALANSPLGAKVLGPIIASARPLLAPAFDALTNANSSLGLVGLVADIVLGVADGSGGVELAIGGATATTSALGYVAPTTPAPAVESVVLPNATPAPFPLASLPQALAPLKQSVITGPNVASTRSLRCALEAAPRRHGGCRDGKLAVAIIVSGLAILAVGAAEIGVRRRRRAEGATAP
ncbi:MAG: hypothetical protein QOJ00_2141 [Actinomycetota bacterium]|jgi:hypothetical protein